MLRRKFTPRLNETRDQEGKIPQSQEEVEGRSPVYCGNLYKDHKRDDNMVRDLKRITPTSIEEPQDILYSEVEEALCSLKKNKNPGLDGIIPEMLQGRGKHLTREIHNLCNKPWQEGTILKECDKSILIPIPKKGD